MGKLRIKRILQQSMLLILFFTLTPTLTHAATPTLSPDSFTVSKGVLDLRGITRLSISTIDLGGEWEMYWQQFLPEDPNNTAALSGYVNVPGAWRTSRNTEGIRYASSGYTTYRMIIRCDKNLEQPLTLYINQIRSAGKLYIKYADSPTYVFLDSAGYSSKNIKETRSYCKSFIQDFILKDKMEIIITISSSHHADVSGVYATPYIGPSKKVHARISFENAKNLFVMGVVSLLAFFMFILFIVWRDDKAPLYLFIFCITFLLHTSVTKVYLYDLLATWQPGTLLYKINFGSLYLYLVSYLAFSRRIFSHTFSKKEVTYAAAPCILAFIVLWVFPEDIYSHIIRPMYYVSFAIFGWILFKFIRGSIQKKDAFLGVGFLGTLAVISTGTTDLLGRLGHISITHTIDYGFLGLGISMGCIIAAQNVRARKKAEQLSLNLSNEFEKAKSASAEIEHLNTTLEAKVVSRTKQLEASQVTLRESAYDAGRAEMATGVLHNIGNLITSIVILNDGLKKDTDYDTLIKVLTKTNVMIEENIDDLTSFFTTDTTGQKLLFFLQELPKHLLAIDTQKKEIFERVGKTSDLIVHSIQMQQEVAGKGYFSQKLYLNQEIKDVIGLYEQGCNKNNISITTEFEIDEYINQPKSKVFNIINNLVKNAKESILISENPTGSIGIKTFATDEGIALSVSDTGTGIEKDYLSTIFNFGFSTKSSGRGFGLHHCANAMTEMNGLLKVESDGLGFGATFTLTFFTTESTHKNPDE